jgi:EAL domain-containing protein (putative c-di-GMP-specific phosphodiesterase class I)
MPTTASSPPQLDGHPSSVADVIRGQAVETVFQPIVDLVTGEVVAHEALARGPEGPLRNPDALFAAARSAGLLADLDRACLTASLRAAHARFATPGMVFVNVEPEALDFTSIGELAHEADTTSGVRIVLEVTERALAARPAELLSTVARVRELGWGVALDDVGAEPASLAFMSLLLPDIIKLDLALVQGTPTRATAEVMHAVNAHAERSGAWVLAEGIETEAHLISARALGATLGQGWMFGKPATTPAPTTHAGLELPRGGTARRAVGTESPFQLLPPGTRTLRSPKRLLIELSKQLEREAARIGETCVITAAFQEARHFTPATQVRYSGLAAQAGFVCALGEGLSEEPLPGVRGASLSEDDRLRGEWDVTVLSPHFSTALLARDLGDDGPELERMFEYALTYERDTVVEATRCLLARVTGLDSPT